MNVVNRGRRIPLLKLKDGETQDVVENNGPEDHVGSSRAEIIEVSDRTIRRAGAGRLMRVEPTVEGESSP